MIHASKWGFAPRQMALAQIWRCHSREEVYSIRLHQDPEKAPSIKCGTCSTLRMDLSGLPVLCACAETVLRQRESKSNAVLYSDASRALLQLQAMIAAFFRDQLSDTLQTYPHTSTLPS